MCSKNGDQFKSEVEIIREQIEHLKLDIKEKYYTVAKFAKGDPVALHKKDKFSAILSKKEIEENQGEYYASQNGKLLEW